MWLCCKDKGFDISSESDKNWKFQYDIINFEREQQEKAMAAANAANQKPDVRKDKDFIDFSMPPPKKITLPKVEIKKDFGPLPFQVFSAFKPPVVETKCPFKTDYLSNKHCNI